MEGQGRGAIAQLVERPSKVPVWYHSTDLGSNHERDMSSHLSDHAAAEGGRKKILTAPSVADIRALFGSKTKKVKAHQGTAWHKGLANHPAVPGPNFSDCG